MTRKEKSEKEKTADVTSRLTVLLLESMERKGTKDEVKVVRIRL